MIMKKVLIASISLCLAAAITSAPLTAIAVESAPAPEYPDIIGADTLQFSALTDFAVADDARKAFVDGDTVVLLTGEISTPIKMSANVDAIDYANGNFYYSLVNSESVYILPESEDMLPGESAEHDFNAPYGFLNNIINGHVYYHNTDTGDLVAVNTATNTITPIEGVKKAKYYGDTIYGILENEFYKITGAEKVKVTLTYSDFDKLSKISVGDVPEKLGAYSTFGENAKIVNIISGTLMTEFELDLLSPRDSNGNSLPAPAYFPVGDSPRERTHNDISGVALLLAEAGNVRLVAKGGKCYLTNAAGAPDFTTISRSTLKEGTTATVNAEDTAYSLPYISAATATFKVNPNEVVTVLYSFTVEANSPLAHDFYLIENKDGSRGYMAAEYLEIAYPPFDEGDTSNLPDPNPKTDDYVNTVVLVLVLITLVLIAAAYLTWLGTTGKLKKSARKNTVNDVDEDDSNRKDRK